MNLYRVECHDNISKCSIKVWAIASDSNDAQEKAIEKMKSLSWKYDDYAGTVELIASENEYIADLLAT